MVFRAVDVVDGGAVRHHKAVKAPFAAQGVFDKCWVGAGGYAVNRVIGTHDGTGVALLHCGFKGGQVGFF